MDGSHQKRVINHILLQYYLQLFLFFTPQYKSQALKLLLYNMGGGQTKSSESHKKQDSNFFRKQMISNHTTFSINAEYQMMEKIGEGTYAQVFKGRSKRTKKICAIKWVDKQKAKGISALLENEFSILRDLDHPNIIKIYGMYEDAKDYYIVSELIKGNQLFDFFKEKKKVNERQAFHIFYQVLLALSYLHKNNIMHRDIKLQNIIFDPKSRILKVLDFGSALQYEKKEKTNYKCVGTVTYIAPEVIGKVYNYKCDNWSLGVFLHLLLSGFAPFSGKDQEETFQKIKQDPISFSNPVWNEVSTEAKELIKALLTKDPEKRIDLESIISNNSWVNKRKHQEAVSHEDQMTMTNVLGRLIKFGKSKLAEIQLGVLVFMINFVINIDNEDSMIRCFHLMDTQGDGVITVSEMVQAMVEFMDRPEKIAEKDSQQVMNKLDFDNSKDISYSQFLVAATDLQFVITDQNLERTFAMIDLDNSGKLSAFELKSNLGQQLNESHYSQLMSFFDQDKDGEISMVQFKKMMKKLVGK